jgi:hypothetical protein
MCDYLESGSVAELIVLKVAIQFAISAWLFTCHPATHQFRNPIRRLVIPDTARRALRIAQVLKLGIVPNS